MRRAHRQDDRPSQEAALEVIPKSAFVARMCNFVGWQGAKTLGIFGEYIEFERRSLYGKRAVRSRNWGFGMASRIKASNNRELIEAVLRGESPQSCYQQAFELALADARKVPPDDLARLAVVCESPDRFIIPVLAGVFHVDLAAGKVKDRSGQDIPVFWAVLALHYLLGKPAAEPSDRYISFMEVPYARGYAKPYQGRIIQRFLHTVGRDESAFSSAAQALAGEPIRMGDLAYEFAVFPRGHMQIIRYRGDDEIAPGVSFLYDQDIVDIFCVEDIVVMSGELIGALCRQSRS